MKTLSVFLLCFAAVCSYAEEPFDVSLAYSSADLSAHYRSMVRHATELYRGDGPGPIVTAEVRTSRAAGFETEEITDFILGTIDLYLRRVSPAGERRTISEAHFGSDIFPPELALLNITFRSATPASNQSVETGYDWLQVF